MKYQHVAIIIDKSLSIGHYGLVEAMRQDFNLQLNCWKTFHTTELEVLITVIECGTEASRNLIRVERERQRVNWIPEMHSYKCTGRATPLFDSVGKAIEIFEKVPTIEDVSFLVLVITDGENNQTTYWNANRLSKRIKELQDTDKWTFAFRVPRGYKKNLVLLGIPEDNISEWEQTQAGARQSSEQAVQAVQTYMTNRIAGKTSTTKFFTNLDHVSTTQVKQTLADISMNVKVLVVHNGIEGQAIKSFVEGKTGRPYSPGNAFYQLNKPEKIQDHKQVIICDKASGKMYTGWNARDLLGLPQHGEVKVVPGNHGLFEIFVQSKSVNRILPVGSKVVLYPAA